MNKELKKYISAFKEIKEEDDSFELTLSKKEAIEVYEEIEKLHSIIKEAREYITSRARKAGVELMPREKELLEILDKVEGNK